MYNLHIELVNIGLKKCTLLFQMMCEKYMYTSKTVSVRYASVVHANESFTFIVACLN